MAVKRNLDVLTNYQRLQRIEEIIEIVDIRCMAVDGPVPPTLEEMTQAEISEIYELAKGRIARQIVKERG